MNFKYTPPEPTGVVDSLLRVWTLDNHKPVENGSKIFTEDQLRAEIERVWRETVKTCAEIAKGYPKYGDATAEEIRELLK